MLHTKKNNALTALFTALVFSTSITMAETTMTSVPQSGANQSGTTIEPETTTNSTSTHKVETTTKEKKEDVGSSAYSIGLTLVTSIMPTVSSKMSSGKDEKSKLIVNAKNDAATFIASNGEVRGAYLEAAIQQLRKDIPTSQANDNQLAQAILTW
ncbi:DUF2388 domain-containing protein [Entomomonas sp. E2T0]|uniref:DUF2388 domain-containing protein n=1 Tax=Entomomonas sp. E2T0 TaxID=2930213 RepID=UPI0022284BB8|nr:DUF2388 domain-containing protein [Entomomonas sp. E2T0]UYZ82811.1 DUF2388 domain-containing protein [Entomomonas sp. E2T0]